MIDFTPSPLNEKYFAGQISIDGIGPEGQRKLFNSTVVLLGLSAVGILVVRGLLSAGVGKIHVIDNSVVKESEIGSYPLFSTNDIGKLKCIILKERTMARWSSRRIELHSIKLTKENAAIVLPDSFDFAISTSLNPDDVKTFYELADERNFHIAGGAALGWNGSFGVYTGNDDLYKQKTQFFLNENDLAKREACLSGVAMTVGGMVTNIVLSALLGSPHNQSSRFEMNMKDFTTSPLYENDNPFADILIKRPQ